MSSSFSYFVLTRSSGSRVKFCWADCPKHPENGGLAFWDVTRHRRNQHNSGTGVESDKEAVFPTMPEVAHRIRLICKVCPLFALCVFIKHALPLAHKMDSERCWGPEFSDSGFVSSTNSCCLFTFISGDEVDLHVLISFTGDSCSSSKPNALGTDQ